MSETNNSDKHNKGIPNGKGKPVGHLEAWSRTSTQDVNYGGHQIAYSMFWQLGHAVSVNKNELAFFQILWRSFQFAENVLCRQISLELISWGLHSSLERERKFRRRSFSRPPRNVKLGIFTS